VPLHTGQSHGPVNGGRSPQPYAQPVKVFPTGIPRQCGGFGKGLISHSSSSSSLSSVVGLIVELVVVVLLHTTSFKLSDGVSFFIEGELINYGAGHAYQNFRDEAAHILVMVTPAGMDQFFEDVTALNKGLSQPDFARVEQLMQSYGMELLGPPLS